MVTQELMKDKAEAAQLSQAYGVPVGVLHNWRLKALQFMASGWEGRKTADEDLHREVRRLKRKLEAI